MSQYAQLPFSPYEIDKLQESESYSNDLVNLEVQAFNAMDGLFKSNNGRYDVKGEPNQTLAIELLYSNAYLKAKEKIMLPIDEFFESLDKHTSNNIQTVNNQINALFNEIFIALFVITFVFIGYLFMLVKAFNQHLRIVKKLSRTDPLTNIRNRRSFFELAEQILTIAKRTKQPLSLLMIDIDLFKGINDTYGHIIGDEILLSLVSSIKQNIRESDVFARFGGKEFIVLLPDTNITGAIELAEKIRFFAETHPYSDEKISVSFTISIGVSEYGNENLMREFIHKADTALYTAKNKGRNQVTCC